MDVNARRGYTDWTVSPPMVFLDTPYYDIRLSPEDLEKLCLGHLKADTHSGVLSERDFFLKVGDNQETGGIRVENHLKGVSTRTVEVTLGGRDYDVLRKNGELTVDHPTYGRFFFCILS